MIAFNILNIGRYKLGAACCGATKAALREAALYANERKQFSQSIGTFAALREKLANIFVKAFALESMAYRTAGAIDDAIADIDKSGPDAIAQVIKAIEEFAIEASIMKVWGSEATDYAMDEAVQIHGGYGYIQEYPVERGYRDSRINRIFEGTNEINRMLIPGTLLKRSMKGQVPLMPFVTKIQKELKDPETLPKEGQGPLAEEIWRVEMAKRGAALACGAAISKHLTKLSKPDMQMILMAMADLIMETFAVDSAVTRAAQIVEEKGPEKSFIPTSLAQVLVADSVDQMRSTAGRLLANCLQGAELDKAIADLALLMPFNPLRTHPIKDELAAHVLERELYNLE